MLSSEAIPNDLSDDEDARLALESATAPVPVSDNLARIMPRLLWPGGAVPCAESPFAVAFWHETT